MGRDNEIPWEVLQCGAIYFLTSLFTCNVPISAVYCSGLITVSVHVCLYYLMLWGHKCVYIIT